MTRRHVVIGIWTVSMVLAAVSIVLMAVNAGAPGGAFTPHSIMAPGYGTVGAMILLRRRHRIGTMFLGFALFAAAVGVLFQGCVWAAEAGITVDACSEEDPWGASLWSASYAFFGALLLLFPTGRIPTKRWLPVAIIFTVSWSVALISPLVVGPTAAAELPGVVPVAVWSLAVCATAPLFRVRRAGVVERQQLRYLGYVLLLCLVFLVVGVVLDSSGLDAALPILNVLIFGGAALGIPAAIGVAILRYRLYEIDLVINRTLVYVMLTAVLAAIYVGLVFVMQTVLAPFTAESDLAIAGSTLAVAALFRPLRTRVQSFIDHRFYRRKVDTQRTLDEFSAHLRDEVELTAVTERLETVVSDALQPAHVSLWLRTDASAERAS
jgi:hypothetical protein